MTASDVATSVRHLAGYRVLRGLARDSDAEVLVGFREGDGPGPSSVVIKAIPSTPSGWRTAILVVEALHRARGEHVVAVLDIAADRDHICLVMERLPRGDLAELLRRRERLDAGEAVTMLAPLAIAVAQMHAGGVAHGALSARKVMFRDDGAPVLIGFARASLFEADAPEVVLEREAGVMADRRALRELALTVLSRVLDSRRLAAQALISELEGCADEFVLAALSTQIFELAAALPVRFTDDCETGVIARDGLTRLLPVRALDIPDAAVRPSEDRTPMAGTLASLLGRVIPDSWCQLVLEALSRVQTRPELHALRQRWSRWSPRRRRAVVIVGAAFMAALLIALLTPSAPSALPSSASLVPVVPSAARLDTAEPAPSSVASTAPVLQGDDPVAAAVLLLHERQRCFRSVSVRCFQSVDQAESAALKADQDAVTSAQHGGELEDPLDDDTISLTLELVQQLGDSALVRLGTAEPAASLLLVKSASGWQIRDVILAAAVSG